ncbi:MAG: hypothetical protein KatS3mg105_0930 [Gemmatales bacterium]|nr:MAG: hypothetical protein KatS3mg105_0930 [Gemmatales bacterium]
MSPTRICCFLWIVASTASSGVWGQAPERKPPPGPQPDRAATDAFAAAVEKWQRKRLPWLDTTIWQKMEIEGIRFEASGRYLAGPNHQLHLSLGVRLARSQGRLDVICDGRTYWEVRQFDDQPPQVTRKFDFRKVLAQLEALKNEQLSTEFFQNQSFHGVEPLLKSVQNRVVFTRLQRDNWQGQPVLKLTGVWNEKVVGPIAPPDRWPQFLPRECRVFLHAETYWPLRFEWWGPLPGHVRDRLILEMEFQKPGFSEIPPQRRKQVFSFKPPAGDIADDTEQTLRLIQQRLQQLQQSVAPPRP